MALAPADQTLLRELYQMWTVVWDQVRVTEPTPGRVIHAIRAVVWRSGWYGVLAARPQLGVATAAQPHPEALHGVLEVVRVGNQAVTTARCRSWAWRRSHSPWSPPGGRSAGPPPHPAQRDPGA